jgi:hexosaminidase
MRIVLALVALCFMLLTIAEAEDHQPPHLMPLPAHAQVNGGQLTIDPSFTLAITGHKDERIRRAAERFLDQFRRQTGMVPLDMKLTEAATASLVVHIDKASKEIPELGEDESYSLEVAASGAKLNAPTTLGALRGLQTFRQLLETTQSGFAVPAVSIQDAPRFPWRGLMIDVGRHFMPLDVLRRNLDGMEAVKLNVVHFHLSENQGFRVESKKLPKLQEKGSDGHYYTQAELKDLVAYAADRGIRVVPEFDMPGHSTSWLVAYPEIASGPGPYTIDRNWGVLDPAMDPTRDETYKLLSTFIGEMAKIFPDKYFHIGGDEVNGKEWDKNPKIQEFMRAHGIKDNADLQTHFNARVSKMVSKNGKIMVGWDEILQPSLPKNIVVQSWRGQESLARAAKQGIHGILSAGYYVDLNFPAARHYAVDPLSGTSANLSADEQKLVLGGESCMWSEFVSPENMDSRIWPRTIAIAERLWSPQNVTDVNSMYERMYAVSRQLDWLGLTHNTNYQPMLRRIANSEDISSLKTLADVVEPVKEYKRGELASSEPTSLTPLNRLVDAARPESETARRFALTVDDYLSGKNKPQNEAESRGFLTLWRDNDAALKPLVSKSFLLGEAAPLSVQLSALGSAGLESLDYLSRNERPPDAWKAQQVQLIEQAKTPGPSQLLLMITPAVQKLVEASTTGK